MKIHKNPLIKINDNLDLKKCFLNISKDYHDMKDCIKNIKVCFKNISKDYHDLKDCIKNISKDNHDLKDCI